MKNLLLTFVTFSVLLLIGCQENSIVDPIQDNQLQKTNDPSVTSGTIVLGDLLVLPGGFQTYYTIEGQIDYTHEKILIDPIPPAPQYYIAIGLIISANLFDGVNRASISSSSNDQVYVSEDGILIFEKVFEVVGNNDQLSLICRFLVTTDGIGLSEMFLVQGYVDPGNRLNKNIGPEPVTYPPVVNNNIN
jgi:hypothetical protein